MMIKKIKQKLNNAWNWTKDKARRFWKWGVVIVIGGVVLAATIPSAVPDIAIEKMAEKYGNSPEIQAKYQMKGASLVMKKIKNPELDKYKNEPKDEIEITLGEENEGNFVPNIKIKRWNEVWFKIKPRITADLKDQELEFSGNRIKFKTPDMEIEFEDFEDSYKMIWYLNSKPVSNVVEFDIESEGLDFWYQPELTQEEIDEDVKRPENVVGSYAVYHQTKGGMNDIYGKDYKVGKLGHIFRPRLKDSNGWEVWGNLHIENGIYSIEIPDDFYNNAVYPIKSNDTFGTDGAGASCCLDQPENNVIGNLYVLSEDAIGISITGKHTHYNQGVDWKYALYASDDSFVMGTEQYTRSQSNGWRMDIITLDFTSQPELSAGNYYIVAWSNDTAKLYYDASTGEDISRDSETYVFGTGGWPAPWAGDFVASVRKNYLYATYTPDAPDVRRIIIIQ